ncbi:MAG: hexosyltransferase [Ilumatobacteraceae bacterium]|nr:hexosyltransferase [Ilumatobacteraceae bacterium]
MTARAIHQVLVGAAIGDAITSMAMTLRAGLREVGPSEIYALHLADDVIDEVLHVSKLGRPRRGDVIVYHASIGEPAVTRWLLSRTEPVVIIYHNITPSQYFLEHEPHFAANLQWGRHELTLLRDRCVLALADSEFNAADLGEIGYRDVRVVPAGLKPSRLASVGYDGRLAKRLLQAFPNGYVLTVSQVLPHKRFESLIEAMHLVQWVHERPLGLVIVGAPRMQKYQQALEAHARNLRVRQMLFAGKATEQELATYYRLAAMFVTTSAHEGLALPPLEAMAFGVPVVARAAGALQTTVGGAGIVLPPDAGPMLLAETIAEIDANPDLALVLREWGAARVRDIENDDPSSVFMHLLEGVR